MSSADHNVALKVVDDWKWGDKPGWRDAYKKRKSKASRSRTGLLRSSLPTYLSSRLPNSSHVVSVSYEAATSKDSAIIANSFARAFITTTLNSPLAGAAKCCLVDEQLKILRKRVEAAQAKVTIFRSRRALWRLMKAGCGKHAA